MTGRLAAREARSIPPLLYPRNLQTLNAGHPRIGCLGFLYNAVASLWRMEKPVNERIQIIMLRLGMISSGSGVRGKRLSGGISWENVIASGDRSSRLWASPLGYGGFYIPPSVPCIFDLLPPFFPPPFSLAPPRLVVDVPSPPRPPGYRALVVLHLCECRDGLVSWGFYHCVEGRRSLRRVGF